MMELPDGFKDLIEERLPAMIDFLFAVANNPDEEINNRIRAIDTLLQLGFWNLPVDPA